MNEHPPSSRLAHQPALDGVRGVAVTMVLLFHGGVSWMHGGYFGVSVFFTLSGFLITSLLIREHASSGRIAPVAFYIRRAKRLLPASTVCLAVVSIMASRDVWRGALHLRRDAFGALFQVANWTQLAGGGSYTDLQAKSAGLLSPLDHYWSLAVEEQFYWLWPLCFLGLATLARRRGWTVTRILLVVTVVFAAAAPAVAIVWGRDAAYWATPARMAEILVGALLAAAVSERRIAPRAWMAPFFLVAVVTIAIAMPAAGGPAYHGAFPLLAIASAGLLLGLQQRGAVTSALSWRPLVGLGAISYGVYLFHFPVFVFLSADRVGSGGVLLLAARFATTLAIAVASYWLIERPIRRATWSGSRTLMHAVIALGLVAVAVEVVPTSDATYWTANASAVAAAGIPQDQDVGAVATVPPPTPTSAPVPTTGAPTAPTDAPSPAEGPGLDSATSARPGSTSPIPTGTVPTTDPETSSVAVTNSSVAADTVTITNSSVPAPDDTLLIVPAVPMLSRPVRIVVVGDSTAEAAGAGLVQWAALNPDVAKVTVIAAAGCGFVRSGAVSTEGGAVDAPNNFASDCRHQLDVLLPDALSSLHPDVVMLMNTVNDVLPRAFDDSGTLLTPIDHEFLTRAIPDYLTLEEFILDNSTAHVAWIRPPAIDPYWLDKTMPARDPVSRSTIDHVMTTVIAVHPGRATVIDLRTWLEQQGLADDHEYRPDGIHEDLDSATDLAARFLGPELVAEAIRVD